jgi:hypothetical protein
MQISDQIGATASAIHRKYQPDIQNDFQADARKGWSSQIRDVPSVVMWNINFANQVKSSDIYISVIENFAFDEEI